MAGGRRFQVVAERAESQLEDAGGTGTCQRRGLEERVAWRTEVWDRGHIEGCGNSEVMDRSRALPVSELRTSRSNSGISTGILVGSIARCFGLMHLRAESRFSGHILTVATECASIPPRTRLHSNPRTQAPNEEEAERAQSEAPRVK